MVTGSIGRIVFRRQLMGDGNFKADHVRHNHPAEDIWLGEGGGMMAKRENIQQFMATHINKLTVGPASIGFFPRNVLILRALTEGTV
jgi:hypothetical protein